MDLIAINGIRVLGKHGADPGERDREQPFDIDLEIELDLSAAADSDDLAATLNYAPVHARVKQIVETTSYALLERLAKDVLDELFADPRVRRARVRIAKPALLDGATPSVTLARTR